MRKRQIDPPETLSAAPAEQWLDVERLASVEVTSEDPRHPVEGALLPGSRTGWRAGGPGPQTLRILFDEPQRIRRIQMEFSEEAVERTQEFVLRSSVDGGRSYQDVVRQQWNFSPQGAAREVEDYQVDLGGVDALELLITPDIAGGDAIASLDRWRLA